MITEILSTLKIHKLTKAQYDRELAAGSIDNNALYLTPAEIESTDYPGCYYRMVDGEQEWINPPMVCGAKYRTTERFEGAAVYTMLCVLNGDEVNEPGTFLVDTYPLHATVVDVKATVVRGTADGEKYCYPLPISVNTEGTYQSDYVMATNYRAILTPDLYSSGEVLLYVQNVGTATEHTDYYITIKYVE